METQRQQDFLQFDTLPNRITVLRMLAVPVVVYLLSFRSFSYDFAAAIIFALAAITDYVDGYLARSTQTITIFGKLMDPLADKFLVVVTLVMLLYLSRIHPVIVMILICREMTISSLRALAGAEGVVIAAGTGGKWKAAIQMIAIPFLILHEDIWGLPCQKIGMVLIYVSIVLSLVSLWTYIVDFFKALRERLKKNKQR